MALFVVAVSSFSTLTSFRSSCLIGTEEDEGEEGEDDGDDALLSSSVFIFTSSFSGDNDDDCFVVVAALVVVAELELSPLDSSFGLRLIAMLCCDLSSRALNLSFSSFLSSGRGARNQRSGNGVFELSAEVFL